MMIIDNIQHVMLPLEMQVDKLEKAKVDKAILFCTTPHPEKAKNYSEFKKEMNTLFELLSGHSQTIAPLDRMRQITKRLLKLSSNIQINSMVLAPFL